jgi:hypothetical protein
MPHSDLGAAVTVSAAAPAPSSTSSRSSGSVVSLPDISPSMLSTSDDSAIAEVHRADNADPKRVGEYVNAILKHYFEQEGVLSAKGTSMMSQTDINEKFRGILIDWLVEVHLKFKELQETLYLTVAIVDRFLEKKVIARTNLQLVGIAGTWQRLCARKHKHVQHVMSS